MLGLTFLFTLGDFRVLAKVTTIPFKDAVNRATTVTKRGADIQAAFDKAKADWKAKNEEGKALIVDPTDRARWPEFLATISRFFPDPEAEYDLDPDDPKSVDTLEMLRVHIDAIKPVYRKDVSAEWFTLLDPKFKMLMHPYDADEKNAPSGEGWVIQVVCHHYNPYPRTREQHTFSPGDRRRTDFGPVEFLTDKVLPKLNKPQLRLFGIHHIAVAWMTSEKEWTSEKGQGSNNLASSTIPLLDRAAAPAGAEGGGGGMAGGSSMASGMMSMMKNYSGGMGGGAGARQGAGMMERMKGMMGGGMAGMYGGGAQADLKKEMKTLTRTDFLLQFVWQPPKVDERPTDEQRNENLKKILTDLTEAEKKNPAVKISQEEIQKELDAASRKKSEQIDSKVLSAVGGSNAPAAGGVTPGAVPPAGMAPGAALPKAGNP